MRWESLQRSVVGRGKWVHDAEVGGMSFEEGATRLGCTFGASNFNEVKSRGAVPGFESLQEGARMAGC